MGGEIYSENNAAREILQTISDRLSGIYNLTNPRAEKIIEYCKIHNKIVPTRGLGALKDDCLPLSVSGQVQRLIEEAIAHENLMQMFQGWMPWF